MIHDVIVVGMGGMGSAAAWQLARRGQRVLGLERFDIPHPFGSSHGVSRIIRLPYYEDTAYVPLLRRAYELWREAEAATGMELLVTTGSIDSSPEDDPLFQGALAAAREHDLPHEVLTGAAVNERFPGYRPTSARCSSRRAAWWPASAPSSPMWVPRRPMAPTSALASGC